MRAVGLALAVHVVLVDQHLRGALGLADVLGRRLRDQVPGGVPHHGVPRGGRLRRRVLRVGVVHVPARAVGQHGGQQQVHGLPVRAHERLVGQLRGVRRRTRQPPAAGVHERRLPRVVPLRAGHRRAGAGDQVRVRVHELDREHAVVRPRVGRRVDAELGLRAHHPVHAPAGGVPPVRGHGRAVEQPTLALEGGGRADVDGGGPGEAVRGPAAERAHASTPRTMRSERSRGPRQPEVRAHSAGATVASRSVWSSITAATASRRWPSRTPSAAGAWPAAR